MIKTEYFSYPTSEEIQRIAKKLPNYSKFEFKSVNVLESIWEKAKDENETNRLHNLYQWNRNLSNRLGKLRQTQIYLLTHFERGFEENHLDCDEKQLVDRILFDYYAEIFYYFHFSVRDSLAQILNLYFRIGKSDTEVYFKTGFFKKIPDERIRNYLNVFLNSTEKAREFRNSFTHRFPVNEKDFRSEVNEFRGNIEMSVKGGNIVDSASLVDNINELSILLSDLLNELKSYFNRTHT